MSRWIEVARDGDLAPGEYKLVEAGDVDLALFRLHDRYCCIEDLCTHDGGNLVEGDFDGRAVTCPRHGAKFDVCTGEALLLPAVESTPVHAVRVRDGAIEVEVEDDQ
jgi:3-phenylpropionate/trans-cinnamate dioxygenase ferredoxin subunit